MNLSKLKNLIESTKLSLEKKLEEQGYTENFGNKEQRRIEAAGIKIAHDASQPWNDRQSVGVLVVEFDVWLQEL